LANPCSYTTEYFNLDFRREEKYRCPYDEHSEGRCKLHLKEYACDKKNKEELIGLLSREVEEADKSGSALKWIGYHIPFGVTVSDKIKVDVYLDEAIFLGAVDFSSSIFERYASFSSAIFKQDVDFSSATFNGKADYQFATFTQIVDFSDTEFKKLAYFANSTFSRDVTFKGAKFNQRADFSAATFNERVLFVQNSITQEINFLTAFFKEQEQVSFDGDLSKASFPQVDITRVRFEEKVVWGKNDFIIYDEHIIEKSLVENARYLTDIRHISLESVIAEYRNLRENYEYNLRYEEAGQFFIREMELRRKYKQKASAGDNKIEKKRWFERIFSFAFLYFFVSNYGESNRRPFIIVTSIFVASTVFFLYFFEGWSIDITSVSDSISRTLTAFFPFLDLPANSGLLEIFLKAIALAFTGLFIVTLRRKLERRFRH
jgi:hypothetical protein